MVGLKVHGNLKNVEKKGIKKPRTINNRLKLINKTGIKLIQSVESTYRQSLKRLFRLNYLSIKTYINFIIANTIFLWPS